MSIPSTRKSLPTALAAGLVVLLILASVLLAATPALAADPIPADPAPGATPVGTSTPTAGSGTPIISLPDPKGWVGEVINAALLGIFGSVVVSLRLTIGGILDGSLNFVNSTPPNGSYNSATVRDLWNAVRLIADAGLALVALWGGFSLIFGEQTGSPYHEAMELFPRLILGVLLVNTSLTWTQLAIDANNALCQAIGGVSLPAWDQAGTEYHALADVIAAIVYFVASLILILQMLMRLALVDVLLVVSPLGLLCWVLPQTQGWARLWSGTFFATVFTQFVQVLALKLGSALLADSAILATDAILLKLLLGVAVIVLTLRIPGLMRLHLDSGLSFARYYAYRQGAQALGGGASGGGGKGAAAAGAGAGAKAGAASAATKVVV